MTRFEYFLKNGIQGVELGIIPESTFQRFIRYQVYLNYLKDGKKHIDAIKLASDDCNCDITLIYKATYFFAKSCKD